MSLLLDALKRAEQEKLARADRPDLQVVGQPPASGAPAAAPAAAAAPRGGKFELEPLAPPQGSGAKTQGPAQAAQALFEAKNGKQASGSRRGLLYAAAGAVLLAVIAAGGYVWYVMKSLTPPPIAPRPAPVVALPSAAPAAPPPAAAEKAPAAVAPVAPVAPEASAPREERKAPAARTRQDLVQQVLRESSAERREPPVRLDRSSQPPRIPAEISTGYEALRKGDLEGARRNYRAALAADGTSVDAALGLATAEARAGNVAAAAAQYRRTLELDPRNATALAGLAALADASRPGTVESQLRQDLMAYPHNPALRFTLANLLASQARWSEAQSEYFEAHRLDPGNPDIAHNLAVSLDQLGQSRLAADFYRRALAAAREQPAQFDPGPVARRLAELGP